MVDIGFIAGATGFFEHTPHAWLWLAGVFACAAAFLAWRCITTPASKRAMEWTSWGGGIALAVFASLVCIAIDHYAPDIEAFFGNMPHQALLLAGFFALASFCAAADSRELAKKPETSRGEALKAKGVFVLMVLSVIGCVACDIFLPAPL